MTMTPKQALIKDGKIAVKDGRGRLSREATERVLELVGMGWDIKGYAVKAVKPNAAPTTPEPAKAVKVPVSNVKEIADYTILWDERDYRAMAGNKEYGMREVCRNCRVSLVQCGCGSPVIVGDVAVTIVPRKTVHMAR